MGGFEGCWTREEFAREIAKLRTDVELDVFRDNLRSLDQEKGGRGAGHLAATKRFLEGLLDLRRKQIKEGRVDPPVPDFELVLHVADCDVHVFRSRRLDRPILQRETLDEDNTSDYMSPTRLDNIELERIMDTNPDVVVYEIRDCDVYDSDYEREFESLEAHLMRLRKCDVPIPKRIKLD